MMPKEFSNVQNQTPNVPSYLFLIITREGGLSNQHLKNENSKTPPVDSPCIGGLGQHLQREDKFKDGQWSAAFTSGARNSGVPQKVPVLSP